MVTEESKPNFDHPESPYSPPSSKGSPKRESGCMLGGCAIGCALIVVLILVLGRGQVIFIDWYANKARDKVRLGMSAHEVFNEVISEQPFSVYGELCVEEDKGKTSYWSVYSKSLDIGPIGDREEPVRENFNNLEELKRAVAELPLCETISFTFRVPIVIPLATFVVYLSPEGQVEKISETRVWD